MNVDFENIGHIPGFLQEISERFADREQKSERCLDLYREIFRLTDLQDEIGIPKSDKGANSKMQLRLNSCIADNIGKCIAIAPDGLFNTCERLPEERTWGNIFDGVTDQATYDALSAVPKLDEACAKCPFLLECTPFYKTGCPVWFKDCYGCQC